MITRKVDALSSLTPAEDVYLLGEELFFWELTSCTTKIKVLEDFIGNGERTVFQIVTTRGVDISAFSQFKGEAEVLLPAGSVFQIKSIANLGGGLVMVQCVDHPTIKSVIG